MFENLRKSLIQHCEQRLQKFIKNAKKWPFLASFWKPEACGQTVLPEDKKKMVENAKTEKL